MQQTMKEKIQAKLKNSEGFTLLEILVVLTIMGFLIAMVAPRLAGISKGAVDTVCDSNQSRMIQMTSAYFEKTGKFPDKLTNIVNVGVETDGEYSIPTVSDGDPANGPETLAEEFAERIKPAIHHLNAEEVAELKGLGVRYVFNLNSYDGIDTDDIDEEQSPMDQIELAPGVGVMMVGMGAEAAGDDFAVLGDLTLIAEPDFIGRIVLGFGPENGLVTSGLVTNAAHCPGGIQDSDNVTYNDYNLVLPRLKATVDRLDTDQPDSNATTIGLQYWALGYTEDNIPASGATITAGDAGIKSREYTFGAMQAHQYATMCPEGHMFPADDSDFWAVSFDGDNAVTF